MLGRGGDGILPQLGKPRPKGVVTDARATAKAADGAIECQQQACTAAAPVTRPQFVSWCPVSSVETGNRASIVNPGSAATEAMMSFASVADKVRIK